MTIVVYLMNMASSVNELPELCELSDFKIRFEEDGYDSLKDILKMLNNEKDLDEMFNLVGMNKPGYQKRFKRQLEELVNQNTPKPNDNSSQSTQDKGK